MRCFLRIFFGVADVWLFSTQPSVPCRHSGVSPTAVAPATSLDPGPRPLGHAELRPGLGVAYAARKALGTHGEPCDFYSWGAPVEFWQICGRNSIRSPQFDGEI